MQQPGVLILENEPLIGLDIATTLKDANFVPHVVSRVECAIQLLQEESIDIAILDLRSANTDPRCEDLPCLLDQLGIPYAFVVGGFKDVTVKAYRVNAPRIGKPLVMRRLLLIARVLLRIKGK